MYTVIANVSGDANVMDKLTEEQAELLAKMKAALTAYLIAVERPEPEGFGITAGLPYSMPLYQALNRIDRRLEENARTEAIQ
jgi:hypothetical protein